MLFILIGLVVLLLVLMGRGMFDLTDIKQMAYNLRNAGGFVALAAAIICAITGREALAIVLLTIAAPLLRQLWGGFFSGIGGTKSSGRKSGVRTKFIEMELDHDTGEMSGRVHGGRFAGRALGSLAVAEMVALWHECRAGDPQGAPLAEAWLDRADPHWREKYGVAQDSGAGPAGNTGGQMSAGEAYKFLGLAPGATRADIQRAHHDLIKRFHPDQGGSNYLAAKINEAKDVLMSLAG